MDANTQTTLTKKHFTPAQVELLDFVSRTEAGSIYEHLHTTLTLAMVQETPGEGATFKAVEAWYFTLELLRHIHLIATETHVD